MVIEILNGGFYYKISPNNGYNTYPLIASVNGMTGHARFIEMLGKRHAILMVARKRFYEEYFYRLLQMES